LKSFKSIYVRALFKKGEKFYAAFENPKKIQMLDENPA